MKQTFKNIIATQWHIVVGQLTNEEEKNMYNDIVIA
jgi:hypothetical protein